MNEILKKIKTLKKPIVIAISGFGGSGKSTFALKLSKKINAPVIGADSFSKSNIHENYEYWDVMDYLRLENEVLKPFISGEKEIRYREFDWDKNIIKGETSFTHDNIIIIEGVGLFRPELMKYFSCTIWIDCPIEEAISRGKKRDREKYNTPQDNYWDGIWKANDLQCLEKYSPTSVADFVIKN